MCLGGGARVRAALLAGPSTAELVAPALPPGTGRLSFSVPFMAGVARCWPPPQKARNNTKGHFRGGQSSPWWPNPERYLVSHTTGPRELLFRGIVKVTASGGRGWQHSLHRELHVLSVFLSIMNICIVTWVYLTPGSQNPASGSQQCPAPQIHCCSSPPTGQGNRGCSRPIRDRATCYTWMNIENSRKKDDVAHRAR